MKTIGSRLRAERLRLGYSQTEFAGIGSVATRTQVSYEKGSSSPGADYLSLIAQHGVDVLFIIIGSKGDQDGRLCKEEELVLSGFRAAPPVIKVSVLAALKSAAEYLLNSKA